MFWHTSIRWCLKFSKHWSGFVWKSYMMFLAENLELNWQFKNVWEIKSGITSFGGGRGKASGFQVHFTHTFVWLPNTKTFVSLNKNPRSTSIMSFPNVALKCWIFQVKRVSLFDCSENWTYCGNSSKYYVLFDFVTVEIFQSLYCLSICTFLSVEVITCTTATLFLFLKYS